MADKMPARALSTETFDLDTCRLALPSFPGDA
jgi:hypothetical protein